MIEQDGFAESVGPLHVIVCCVPARCRDAFVFDAARARAAPPFLDPPGYARHRPEATLLYQLVQRHYPGLRELRSEAGRPLPKYVQEEFEAYLKCGRLDEGFLRVRCEGCHAEKLVAFSPDISPIEDASSL
jgi:Transposase zinc-binding domain